MGHISILSLFDYLTGAVDLNTQDLEHLRECEDCHELSAEVEQVILQSGNLAKTRELIAEDGELPSAAA